VVSSAAPLLPTTRPSASLAIDSATACVARGEVWSPNLGKCVCEDRSAYCSSWMNDGQCDSNMEFMTATCAAACRRCNATRAPARLERVVTLTSGSGCNRVVVSVGVILGLLLLVLLVLLE
jgi:hypothetical protein